MLLEGESSERTHGWYRCLESPWVYDWAQFLVRSHRSRQRFIERMVRPHAGMRVFDFGCGTATVCKHLAGVNYLGVDLRPAYIESARRRFPKARFQCCDATAVCETEPGTFDRVLALGVLHHLADDAVVNLMRLASQLLKPDGEFVSHDPTLAPQQASAARWFVRRDRGKFVRTPDELASLVAVHLTPAEIFVDHRPLRIPYTEVLLRAAQKAIGGQSPSRIDGLAGSVARSELA